MYHQKERKGNDPSRKKKSNFIFEKERYLLSLETNIELYIKWPKQMRLDMFSICTIAIVRSFKRKYDSSFLSLKWRNLSILIEILLITYIDVGQLSILFTPDNSFFGDEKMIFKSKESFPITNYQT